MYPNSVVTASESPFGSAAAGSGAAEPISSVQNTTRRNLNVGPSLNIPDPALTLAMNLRRIVIIGVLFG